MKSSHFFVITKHFFGKLIRLIVHNLLSFKTKALANENSYQSNPKSQDFIFADRPPKKTPPLR